MNALRVAIVTFGAVLLSSTFQMTDATSCDLMKIFTAVKPLESSIDVAACMVATGYEMLPPSGPPTDAQIAKLCGTSSCQSVFTALQKLDIPDCTIDILGGLNIKQTFAGIITKCGGSITGGSTSTSQASQPLAAATPAPSAKVNGNASDTPAMTAAPVPATTSTPAATAAPAKANIVTTSAPATTAPSAKATTATSTPASSTTPTTAPSKAGASIGTVHAAEEPTLEPQMCV